MSKILVCDDDKDIVEAIDIYLTQEGYTVLKAYDGQEAIKVLKEEKVDLPCTRDIDLYVGILGQEAKAKAYQIVVDLRDQGFVVETDYLGRSVKAQMKYANKLNAKNTIIIGDDELAKNEGNVKNMETREVTTISLDKIADCLK